MRARLFAVILASASVVSLGAVTGCPQNPRGAREIPSDAKVIKLSLHGLDCAECGSELQADLLKVDGVYDTHFNKKRVVMTVFVKEGVSPDALLAVVKHAGFTAEVGDMGGSWLPQPRFEATDNVDYPIKDGTDLQDLGALAFPGKVTVLDLFANWCKPCREVDEHMKTVMPKHPDVTYRKLDVVDWDSPLAVHYLATVKELPYVIVYGRDRKQVDAISGLDLKRLDAAIGAAESTVPKP
jgi:thiol-disulfide isomerase/thioredoxin